MMKSSLFSNLLARPEKLLRDHIQRVSELCSSLCLESKLNLDSINLKQDKMARTLELIGWCHDFGKATLFFQEYIQEKDDQQKRRLKNKKETHHSLISAVFTYYVLKNSCCTSDTDLDEVLPLIGYLVVKRHHGNLKNIMQEIRDLVQDNEKQELLKKQVESISKKDLVDLYKNVFSEEFLSSFINDLDLVFEQIKRSRRHLKGFLKAGKLFPAILLCYSYSILLQADKEHASGISVKRCEPIPDNLVESYRNLKKMTNSTSKINLIRNRIYKEITQSVDDIDFDNKIYSLNAPTGTGKTITAFAFANKLASRLRSEKGINPRLFYCISFISIIDQNFNVFENIFEEVIGNKPSSNLLLKHHHLADTFYFTDDDEFESEKGLFLVEGWNSEVIVTTFVQLFHTLFTNRNRSLRKYHRLANSIIILDEVQSLPQKYWLLFREYLKVFSSLFNTYFIFMTATQPLIFEPGSEIRELCVNKKQYFRNFDRLDLIPYLEPMEYDTFVDFVVEDITANPEKSFLIIMNTINSSQKLYRQLEEYFGGEELFYLSTRIFPKERLARIIRMRKSRKRRIIVSTQLVEAGVDLDVDIVYRDFATLDSVVQASGRCNRNFADTRGLVKLFRIKDEKRFFYSYIYGGASVLIDKTLKVLEGKKVIPENKFNDVVENYYKEVQASMSNDEALGLLESISRLEFDTIQQEFNLIAEDYPKIDVFIEYDKEATKIWSEFQTIQDIPNPIEKRQKFLKIKKQLRDYTISVPKNFKELVGYMESIDMGYLSKTIIQQTGIYNKQVGLVKEHVTDTFFT